MATPFGMSRFLLKLHAARKRAPRQVAIAIVRRSDTARDFQMLARRRCASTSEAFAAARSAARGQGHTKRKSLAVRLL
jgi:hypothetical protein